MLLDKSIIAVPAIHTLGRAEIVIALQLDSGNFLRDIDQLIYRYGLTRSEIDRLQNLGIHDQMDAFQAVINEHEATGLIAWAPDIDFVLTENLCFDYFPADGRGSFLPPSVPCTPRPVDVMKPCNARVETIILPEVPTHPLRKELFPSIAIFREGGVGVHFFERGSFECLLLVSVVYTRG